MGLEVEVAGGTLNARWAPSAGAHGYELQIFAADGRLMHSVEAATPTATVDLRDEDFRRRCAAGVRGSGRAG